MRCHSEKLISLRSNFLIRMEMNTLSHAYIFKYDICNATVWGGNKKRLNQNMFIQVDIALTCKPVEAVVGIKSFALFMNSLRFKCA